MSISTYSASKPALNSTQQPQLFSTGNALPFFLMTALFLFWGIPSNLNDILIKQFMKSFEVARFKAGLIQSGYYMGHFLLAVPAALLMRKYTSGVSDLFCEDGRGWRAQSL